MGASSDVPGYVTKLKSYGLDDNQVLAFLSSLAPFIQEEVQLVFSEILSEGQLIALYDVAKENYLSDEEFYILLEEAYSDRTQGKNLNDLVDKFIADIVEKIATQVDKFVSGLQSIAGISEDLQAEKAFEDLLVSIIE